MKTNTFQGNIEEVVTAKVVANYDDPGLKEDYHFDILSRFVVVMFNNNLLPTSKKWRTNFALVLRPEHLWISVDGEIPHTNYTVLSAQLKRRDAYGTLAVGGASTIFGQGIPEINQPYRLGEEITIKRLKKPIKCLDSVFSSDFDHNFYGGHEYYNSSYYNQGIPNTHITSMNWEGYTRYKAIRINQNYSQYNPPINGVKQPQTPPSDLNHYIMGIIPPQLELFMHREAVDETNKNLLVSFFKDLPYSYRDWINSSQQGGYVYKNRNPLNDTILFNSVEWVDTNIGNKQRVYSNDCVPLIVTTPNTFTTPKTRTHGTITYNPTLVTIEA